MTRYIEVTVRAQDADRYSPPYRLSWGETQILLDELGGAPADTGALLLRSLRDEDGYSHLRVVTEHDGREDPGSWAPLDTLIRLAEYRDADLDAQQEAEEHDESERRHQAAHAAGVIS